MHKPSKPIIFHIQINPISKSLINCIEGENSLLSMDSSKFEEAMAGKSMVSAGKMNKKESVFNSLLKRVNNDSIKGSTPSMKNSNGSLVSQSLSHDY